MTREQAINYLFSCGFTNEQVGEVVRALTYEPTTKNDLVTLTFSKGTLKYSCKDYVVYKKDWLRSHYGAEIDIMFGDSQYKEPTTKNNLGVEEVTALAEWTEKLTQASEDAYNKGYEDGMKAQEPKTGVWIEHFDESGKWYECDQCHTDWGGAVNFCPDCGADMRGEK